MLLDGVDGVSNGSDLVRFLVWDLDIERLLEGRRQVQQRNRIGVEVGDERRIEGDALFGNVQSFLDDASYFVGTSSVTSG